VDDNSKYKLILQVMKESIHKIKRVSQKLGIRIARAMDPINKDERTNTDSAERDASQVFRKMVKSENSELLISPISNKKYVKNDDKQVLLILDDYQITLINHVFSYTIRLSQKTARNLVDTFNVETERRRLEMEAEFKTNVRHSLQTIITNLND